MSEKRSLLVENRRYSRLPVEIPVLAAQEQSRTFDLHDFSGTTPLGLELIRRQIYGLKKKLAEAGIQLVPATGEREQVEQGNGSASSPSRP